MSKKGFTLIELLAVIVILAIIALIATPIILNIISDAKEESNERSVELYGKAVEQAIAKAQLNGTEVQAGDLSEEFLKTVQYSGSEVRCTTNKLYEDGSIYLAGCRVGTDTKEYTYGTQKIVKLCTANKEKVKSLVYAYGDPNEPSSYTTQDVGLLASESGAYTPGVTYTCNLGDGEETFYVLEENGDNVTLLLGRNLGDTVGWGSVDEGPITAMNAIIARTSEWTALLDLINDGKAEMKLPTYDQLYKAAGNKTSEFPIWMLSYTKHTYGSGYWTSTASSYDGAFIVFYFGSTDNGFSTAQILSDGFYGVRPVITITKSSIN